MSFRRICGRWMLMSCLLAGMWNFNGEPAEGRMIHGETQEILTRSAGPNLSDFRRKEERNVTGPMGTMLRRWEVESRDTGGTLLFSDSPEYVSKDGVLYEDTVSGEARILYYHLNNTSHQKKVAVVLENPRRYPVTVTVTRGGDGAPDSDYLKVGKATQTAYFRSRLHDVIYLKPGAKGLLQVAMDQRILYPGQLVYGVYDFSATGPVKVSVIMYPEDVSPYDFVEWAEVLPKDEQRLRGTFRGMDRVITSRRPYDGEKEGPVYIPLADDVQDAYRVGVDATDGSRVVNCGNYGVLYRLQIPTSGNGRTKYMMSPLGGVYAGAMVARVHRGNPRLILTPAGQTYFGDREIPQEEYDAIETARQQGYELLSASVEHAELGDYANFLPVTFEFSPPGASNLPVNFILMPAR